MRDVNSRANPTIHVIGSGEAFSSEDGNTSYLLIGGGGPGVLLDCGYQIPERIWRVELESQIELICLTHLHADHVFGIVPLLCRYWEDKRKKPLTIAGGAGTENYVRRLMELGYPGLLKNLKYKLEFLEISEAREVLWKHIRIKAARTEHSVRNFTYRIDFKDRFRDRKSGSFAVSGDGRMTPETCELVKDVDVLFQEIYTVKESIPVHMDLKTFEHWIPLSQIKRIGVSHHSRFEISAIERRIASLSKKDPRWFSVRPGMKIRLG